MQTKNEPGFGFLIVVVILCAIGFVASTVVLTIDAGRKEVCVGHLQRISFAKITWAFQKKKVDKDIPGAADLQPYLEVIPRCPSGGEYDFNAVEKHPRCSVTAHKL